MFLSVDQAVALSGWGQTAVSLLLTLEKSLLIYAWLKNFYCACVSFQLTTETTVLNGQSVSGLRRRSIRVPLWRCDMWKLQSLLQKSCGRYDVHI